MSNNKRVNRVRLYFKIWLVHILIYYPIFVALFLKFPYFNTPAWRMESIGDTLLSPFLFIFFGIFGYDGFLLYVFMASMGIILIFTNDFFKAYYLPMCIFIIGAVTYTIVDDFQFLVRGDEEKLAKFVENVILSIPIPIAITINWFVFSKIYGRLKEENLQNIRKKSTDEYYGNDEGK